MGCLSFTHACDDGNLNSDVDPAKGRQPAATDRESGTTSSSTRSFVIGFGSWMPMADEHGT